MTISGGNFFASLARRLRRDSGSVMVTVLVIMLVLTIGGVGVAAIAMNTAGSGVKSSERGAVYAIVDGGVAEQTARLMTREHVCDSSQPPATGTGTIVNESYSWSIYCVPMIDYDGYEYLYLQVSAQVGEEKIARRVTFGYNLNPHESGSPVPGVVFFGHSDFAKGEFFTDFANSGHHPSKCDTVFYGDFINRGNINVGYNCNVSGDMISLEGEIQGNGGVISGNVIADGNINLRQNTQVAGSIHSLNGWVKLENASEVQRNVRSKYDITLYGQSKIYGHAYSTDGVHGNIYQGGNGEAPPPGLINVPSLPTLPEWYKYKFDPADWPGYTVFKLVNGNQSNPLTCQHYNNASGQGWKRIKNFTGPVVIDARDCERLKSDHGDITVELKHNVVLLATQYDLGKTDFKAHSAATGQPHLWIVTEDTDPYGTPPYGGKMVKIDKTNFYNSIRTMVYTPYKVQVTDVSKFTGQIYGGEWDGGGGNGLQFFYQQILLPGMSAINGGDGSVSYVPGDIVDGTWGMLSATYIPIT